MRDFLFNSEELLDKTALEYLENEETPGILPCKWVRWNSMIQLVYFTEGLRSITNASEGISFETLKKVGIEILDYVRKIEDIMELSVENVIWDLDSIYTDEAEQVYLICLPAVLPVEVLESRIYVKRIYSLLEELFKLSPEGETVCRQIEYLQEKDPGNWDELREAMERPPLKDDDRIILRSINLPEPVVFVVGHDDFFIGSDDAGVDGFLEMPGISPLHALIGWNDISFFIQDLNSESGTFLNDHQIPAMTHVPFGTGSIIRFGDCTFNVENAD